MRTRCAGFDGALKLPAADAYPRLRAIALCIKVWALWPLGRGAEQPTVLDEAEAIARALADPVIVSRVLETRAGYENGANRPAVARPFADEALRWARTSGDGWAIAMAAFARAMASAAIGELRERVSAAASLLDEVGNVYHLADLLASAAYGALCKGADRDAREFVGRAIPITRDLENPYLWMLLRGNFGLAALFTGDTDAADEAFREELTLCRERVVLPFASEGLDGLAAVAAIRDDLDRAARLVGAAAAHRYRQPEDPVNARLRTTFFEPACTRYGAEAWATAGREGTAMSFQHAIAYALEEPRA